MRSDVLYTLPGRPALSPDPAPGVQRAAVDAGGRAQAEAAEGEPHGSLSGRQVEVHGLQSRPELNGERGEAMAYDQGKGRYAVQLSDGGAPLLLKPENLRPVS